MTSRRWGPTDIRASAIGLGCWQFSEGKGLAGAYWPAVDRGYRERIVRRSYELGVDWFDTAEAYGRGASERGLSQALQSIGVKPGDVRIATKWDPTFRTSTSIRETFADRKSALEPFGIDLHQVHHPWGLSPVEAEMREMAKLVEREQIRAVGVSNFTVRGVERAHAALERLKVPLATHQVKYSLLDRRIETNGVLDAAERLDVAILAYSPLEQGLLTGKFHREPERLKQAGVRAWLWWTKKDLLERTRPVVERLEAIGQAHGAKPGQVALAWLVQRHGDRVSAIVGARTPAQAEDNAQALDLVLSPGDLEDLDRVSRPFRDQPA
jgi:aryl-alcohol dehydrogenase-like predicted oxidoreductase